MAVIVANWIPGLLTHILGDLAEARVRKPMEEAQKRILSGMRAKGLDIGAVSVTLLAHDAAFRLWKAVVRSGDLADLIRDHFDDEVVDAVLLQLPTTLEAVVVATRDASLEQVFGKP